ncbi:MAG: GTPase Era [Candidatus Ancillula sp.]|nr:GTPase Era [Candidatus Ancillula sp.]
MCASLEVHQAKQRCDTRCGFVALMGRPNVGKSTLLNALLNASISIVSNRPETTRKAIRGILTRDDYQIIFVDTPGIHRPRTLLGKRLNAITDEQLSQVDVLLFLTPADEKMGPGDEFILKHAKQIASKRIKLYAVVTKIDKVKPQALIERLGLLQEKYHFDHIIPLSAAKDNNLDELVRVLVEALPESDFLYDSETLTDESWQSMVAEAVREAALSRLQQELPHSLVVQVVEKVEDVVYVNLYVERDSQKGIILGKGGENIKQIRKGSTRVAREILGNEVHLNLQVKVAKNWQQDTKLLQKFGF